MGLSEEQRELQAWGQAVRRTLPWRRTRDPWAVLVSEVMLQQTQADRVVPRWERFMARWPSPTALARVELAEVLVEWSGLGYPRRARNLHRCAADLVERHEGRVPDELADLLALPGVGDYTARAVLVFAFERDGVGVVDTNIARILARRAGRRLSRSEAQAMADGWAAPGSTWAHHQSLMDLGASRCRPNPRCSGCPLERTCTWRRSGNPPPDPAEGSAGVSGRQARFEGSDRQGRGRLLRAAVDGPILRGALAAVAGWPGDVERAERVVAGLVADGLLESDGVVWFLPAGQATSRPTGVGESSDAGPGRPRR